MFGIIVLSIDTVKSHILGHCPMFSIFGYRAKNHNIWNFLKSQKFDKFALKHMANGMDMPQFAFKGTANYSYKGIPKNIFSHIKACPKYIFRHTLRSRLPYCTILFFF
jgi:hypothetical protein